MTVVVVVVVVIEAAVAAAAFDRSFLGQNLEICPNCLQLQRRRLPFTTTIICLSLLMIVSGIA